MKIYTGLNVNTYTKGKFVRDTFRQPKAGEYFLSGARPCVYHTKNDLDTEYWVMKPTSGEDVEKLTGTLALAVSEAITEVCKKNPSLGREDVLRALKQLSSRIEKL